MNDDYIKKTQCEGKFPYDSAQLANTVARRRTKAKKERLMSYRCGVCGKWHLGGNSKRIKKQ